MSKLIKLHTLNMSVICLLVIVHQLYLDKALFKNRLTPLHFLRDWDKILITSNHIFFLPISHPAETRQSEALVIFGLHILCISLVSGSINSSDCDY